MADRIIDVIVNGAFLTKNSKNAGVQNEGNVTTLHIVMDDSWAGYGKRIVWRNALGENPVSLILYEPVEGVENLEFRTTIPREALDQPGWCSFTIEGYKEENDLHQVALTVQDFLQVYPSDHFYSPAEPTPGTAQQIMEKLGDTTEQISILAKTAKSWAVGGTGSRDGEDTDNAKYYALQSKEQALQAEDAKDGAETAQEEAEVAQAAAEEAKKGSEEAQERAEAAQAAAEEALAAVEQAPATAQLYHERMKNRDKPDQHPMKAITGLLSALDAFPIFYVFTTRIREPWKPDYGLGSDAEDGTVSIVLDAESYTGSAEVSAIVSGMEYDMKNMSVDTQTPNGTMIITKEG